MGAARPAAIRLHDLAAPEFSGEASALRAAMMEMGCGLQLDAATLMDEASAQTGLRDFGEPSFRERLAVLVTAITTEGGLSPMGVLMQQQLLLQLLRNRLLLQDLFRRHPEIDAVPIDRPIIICGLPRTGTTHLHNLMSSDPALRSLAYWESLEPVLPAHEQGAPGDVDPRIGRAELACGFIDLMLPHFKRMHEMTATHIHEEIQLLAIDFSTMLFETIAVLPTWRAYYLSHDQTPHYVFLRRVLQALQWLRGGTRWVLKSPQHIEQFPVLARVFPDATFVVTHRDPVAVTQSMATMAAYTSRLAHAQVDPAAIGRYWGDRIERLLRACVQDRSRLPTARTLDVRFDEFMADDLAMVRRVYALAEQPFTPAAERGMRAFMAANPRGKHGGIDYDLAALGMERGEREAALGFYTERFGVAVEGQG
jgi:LPS sulfotransferase NodH